MTFQYSNRSIVYYPMTAVCHDAVNSKTLNVGRGGSTYDGTLVNTPTKRTKRGYDFDNTANEYISIPVAAWPGTSGSFLITMSYAPGSNLGNDATNRVIGTDHSSGNNYEQRMYIDGQIAISYTDGSTVLGNQWFNAEKGVLQAGIWTWELVAGTTTSHFYSNGVENSNTSAAKTLQSPDIGLYLARWGANFFDGTIYHAELTPVVLTPIQVQDYYIAMMKKINDV